MQNSGYYLDLNRFTLEELKELLKSSRLLPSQQILLDDIDERFAVLKGMGIESLAQLQKALKTKKSVVAFAAETGMLENYLTVLRREVNSYQPKPINLKDFPGVDMGVIQTLEQQGIKNTKQLFPHVLTPESREVFAEENQIVAEDLLELTKLTDVARLKWVGPKFARLVIESPYDTVENIAGSDYEEFYRAIMRVNEEKGIYKGGLGLEDMKLWITAVVPLVPQVIVY